MQKLVDTLLGIKYLWLWLPDTQSTNLRGRMMDMLMALETVLGEEVFGVEGTGN